MNPFRPLSDIAAIESTAFPCYSGIVLQVACKPIHAVLRTFFSTSHSLCLSLSLFLSISSFFDNNTFKIRLIEIFPTWYHYWLFHWFNREHIIFLIAIVSILLRVIILHSKWFIYKSLIFFLKASIFFEFDFFIFWFNKSDLV